MIRWWLLWVRFKAQLWWLILTGRGKDDAPVSLLHAYNRQADAWNHHQGQKLERS
jgi:hypothetical protein